MGFNPPDYVLTLPLTCTSPYGLQHYDNVLAQIKGGSVCIRIEVQFLADIFYGCQSNSISFFDAKKVSWFSSRLDVPLTVPLKTTLELNIFGVEAICSFCVFEIIDLSVEQMGKTKTPYHLFGWWWWGSVGWARPSILCVTHQMSRKENDES